MVEKPLSGAPGEPGPPHHVVQATDAGKKESGRAHLVSVENLIVHKYSDPAVLLQKADKVARQLIHEELREGELLQVVKPGRYLLHFPRLKPDAGELRCSVITGKLYRAIRELNPAAQQLDAGDETPAAPAKTASKTASPAPARAAAPAARPASAPGDSDRAAEMKKISSAAMAAMTGPGAISQEELLSSPLGRELSSEMTLELSPVWFATQRVIIGHDCVPHYKGAPLRNLGNWFKDTGADPAEIRAIVDTVTYERVTSLMKEKTQRPRGLMICPVHASTLAHAKFVGAFLAAGSGMTEQAQNYLMFLVKSFPVPISRIKVRDAAGYLRPRARGLIADLLLTTTEVNPCFKEFGFHGARTTVADAPGSEAAILKHLNTFAERCEIARLRSTIDGLESSSLTVGALAAGFSYLSGTAIQRRAGEGAEIQDFDIDTLFM